MGSKNYKSKGSNVQRTRSEDKTNGYSKKSKEYSNKDPRDEKTRDRVDKAEKYSSRGGRGVNEYVGQENDAAWYMRNNQLVQDAAKISFGTQLGAHITLHQYNDSTKLYPMTVKDYAAPSILALDMLTCPGIATRPSDGVNLAASGLFQYIRKNLSTVASYAAADVMMYVLGLDAIYSMYANILRAFGIVNAYSAINLSLPNDLLLAGYRMDSIGTADFKRHINTYRSRFNNLIYKASTLYLPTDFTITARHSWLFSNYFWDENTTKGQIYIHRCANTWILDETVSDQGTALRPIAAGNDIGTMLNVFESMIDAYRNSDSMLKIAADMRRAFEGRSQWKLAYCDEGYMVLPTYSREVLSQINNMTIFCDLDLSAKVNYITQSVNHNIVRWQPRWNEREDELAESELPATCDKILNFHWDSPTVEDIAVATRNMVNVKRMPSLEPTGKSYLRIESCGTDICTNVLLFTHSLDGDPQFAQIIEVYDISKIAYRDTIGSLAKLSVFDWSPIVFGRSDTDVFPISDLGNYTVMPYDTLTRLHDNILCSMWSIPQFGGFDA